jgi:hypothetical protein
MRNILLLLIIGSILTSCHKEEQQPNKFTGDPDTLFISSYTNPYLFETNNYWLYQEENTLQTDSFIVTGVINDFHDIHYTSQVVGKKEYYRINYRSSLTNAFYNYQVVDNLISRNGNIPVQSGQPVFQPESNIGTEINGAKLVGFFDTLSIGNNTFTSVYQVKITQASQVSPVFDHDTYLYFRDSIGLIRYEYIIAPGDTERWNIQSWQTSLRQ